MNAFEKSEAIKEIKASLRKGFQDGSSKMAKRRCYGFVKRFTLNEVRQNLHGGAF